MPLITKPKLLKEIAPPIDASLACQLVDEFVSIERRFILGDWEPAELDGGQFCEILARILYHQDSGNLNLTRSVHDCVSYIENNSVTHHHSPRKEFLHLARVLRTIYKFRSDRGAVHISPTYEPNHMDAKLIIESVRWCFAETLRIFWNGDREEVARAIRHLLKFDTPCVGIYGDQTIVQRTGLKVEEEILVLLHHAGEEGLARAAIARSIYATQGAVTKALAKLERSDHRQIIRTDTGKICLTDLGAKRIRQELAEKLRIE